MSSLKLYIGCMFSGKSQSLLTEIKQCLESKKKVIAVNHSHDRMRRDMSIENRIETHNGDSYPAFIVTTLSELFTTNDYIDADVVVIDEAQFYTDLYNFIKEEVKRVSKVFIVAGLSGNYKMELIGQVYKLIPIADEIVHLHSLCSVCKNGTKANFSKRKYEVNAGCQNDCIDIGAEDKYAPVCRYHFHN